MDAPDPDHRPQALMPAPRAVDGQSPDNANRSRLVSADRAAAQLGVNTSTLNRWVRQGRLGYVRVGSVRRYDPVTLGPPAPAPVPHRPDRRDEKLWTATDVAARLGVSSQLVVRFARRGDFASSRTTGGRLRFSRGEIERFAGAQQIDPGDAVSLSGAAVRLGVSARTLKRWGAAGVIELHRGLAGAEVVHRDDLERLVAERGRRPAPRECGDLTTHDVAVLLGRSEEWVRQRAKAGVIPSRRPPGGHRRFRFVDLPIERGAVENEPLQSEPVQGKRIERLSPKPRGAIGADATSGGGQA